MTDDRKKSNYLVLLPLPFRLLIGGFCIILATVMLSVSYVAMLALYDPDVYLEQFYQFMMEPDLSFFMYNAFNTVSVALGMTFTIVQLSLLLVFLMASASWLITGDFWSGPAKCLKDACKETAQCACELWEEANAALLYSRGDLETYGSPDEEEEQENENEDDGKENGEDIEMGEYDEENENKRRGEEDSDALQSSSFTLTSMMSSKPKPSKAKGEGRGRRRKRKVKRSNSEESVDLMHEWTLLSEKSDKEKETEIPEGEQKEKKEERERREISAKNKEEEPLENKEEVEEMPRREKLLMEKEKRRPGSGETSSEAIGRQ